MIGRSLLVVGSGGHGRSVLGVVLASGNFGDITFATNVDDPEPIGRFEMLDERLLAVEEVKRRFDAAFVAIGDNQARLRKTRKLLAAGIELPVLVHPSAVVSPLASIGPGTVVCPGAVVNPFARVGVGCIVNTGAVVEHDCEVADGAHLSPHSAIGGGSKVGEGSWLCVGSCMADHITLPSWSILAAGAALVSEVDESGLYVGLPAVLKKSFKEARKREGFE